MRKFKEKFNIAIDMKWRGFKYPEIAEKLGVSLDTVKSWFRKNGLLDQHYKDYVHDQFIMRKQEQQRREAEKTHENALKRTE
ncbi:helix-turn-helix domain-containing protein [Patescibacteria group bacterium]|nr:helix-turn-helix domain-containing protein [Patescibacteria group bacterium]